MRLVRSSVILLVAVSIVGTLTGPAAHAKKRHKTPSPVTVGTDDSGDWGGGGPEAQIGDSLGQDLVAATIQRTAPETVSFVIKVNAISQEINPASQYIWEFTAGDTAWQLTSNPCDPADAAGCSSDPGLPRFSLLSCSDQSLVVLTVGTCETAAVIGATVDASEGTITIPIALTDIGVQAGDTIDARGMALLAYTMTNTTVNGDGTPYDRLTITKAYTIPR